ncbi:hypothetical protein [Chryseobacterium binzhouense]|uniref:hypothetical protein n=1 Tax=Chryseobacterium binzhouense TaxID=2593646 RepID=UPI00117E3C57|nr:hypothetical protein [Chryseobacterium binzhouense]
MKKLLPILILIFLFSCKTEIEKASEQQIKDSIMNVLMDEMGDNFIERNFNNNEIKNAPVKILFCKFVQDSTSTQRNIELFYKNVSKKNIVAVRFKWYGENIYGDPADMGIYKGYGGGSSEQLVKPNEEAVVSWNNYSNDGKNIIGCRPEEIVFEDGSKWKLKNLIN